MTTWFTSDLHIDHRNIILPTYCNRPFDNLEHMQQELILRHNSVVCPDDTVYFLGDFSLNEKTVPYMLPQFNGIKHLIMGNHDRCHPSKKGHTSAIKRYLEYGFVEVCIQKRVEPFILHHMPYVGDSRHEQRYLEYHPIDDGSFLLHGHTHQKTPLEMGGRQINVGVDAHNFTPVRYEALIELMETIK